MDIYLYLYYNMYIYIYILCTKYIYIYNYLMYENIAQEFKRKKKFLRINLAPFFFFEFNSYCCLLISY